MGLAVGALSVPAIDILDVKVPKDTTEGWVDELVRGRDATRDEKTEDENNLNMEDAFHD